MIIEQYVAESCALPSASIPTNVTVPRGRWSLSSRSTLPYVGFQSGGREEVLTWGESVELYQDSVCYSKSLHAGDLALTTASPVIPGAVTIPAEFAPVTIGGTPCYQTRVIDVRGAKYAYLCLNAVVGTMAFRCRHKSYRTRAYGTNTWATATGRGEVLYTVTGVQYLDQTPLGIGSGSNYDTGAGSYSLPELRPMALLDSLQVDVTVAQAGAAGWLKAATFYTDAFFLLVYR